MGELWLRIKSNFTFDEEEIRNLILCSLVAGFIFSFNDWGEEKFNLMMGIKNLFLAVLISFIALVVHLSLQKIWALKNGFQGRFQPWWPGLLISFLVIFFSFGKIPLLLFGTLLTNISPRRRVGTFRYGFDYWENARIIATGSLANLLLAILAKAFLYLGESFFFQKFLMINIFIAIWSLLPLPKLDGYQIFFGGLWFYLFVFLSVVLTGLFLFYLDILWAIVFGLLLAAVIYFVFYYFYS